MTSQGDVKRGGGMLRRNQVLPVDFDVSKTADECGRLLFLTGAAQFRCEHAPFARLGPQRLRHSSPLCIQYSHYDGRVSRLDLDRPPLAVVQLFAFQIRSQLVGDAHQLECRNAILQTELEVDSTENVHTRHNLSIE